MSFFQYDFSQIVDAINALPAGGIQEVNFYDVESSGDTTSSTGLAFGSTYQITIPAGKKALIKHTGGALVSIVGGTRYHTITGFYMTFSGGFLPSGYYFGDINGQTPTKIKVGGGLADMQAISPFGAQVTSANSQILSVEILNISGGDLTVYFRKAVKRGTVAPGVFAAWNASAGRSNNFSVIIV